MAIGKKKIKDLKLRNCTCAEGDNEVTEDDEVLEGNVSSSGNSSEATTEIGTNSEVASTLFVIVDHATSEPPENDKDVKPKSSVVPSSPQKIVDKDTEVMMEAPINATATPESIATATDGDKVRGLHCRHQPGQAATRDGNKVYSEAASKDQQQPIAFQISPNHNHKMDHKPG